MRADVCSGHFSDQSLTDGESGTFWQMKICKHNIDTICYQ